MQGQKADEGPKADEARLKQAFGTAVRLARTRSGLSAARLAREADVDRKYLLAVEKGRKDPGLIWQRRVAIALGLTLVELIARTEAEMQS